MKNFACLLNPAVIIRNDGRVFYELFDEVGNARLNKQGSKRT